MESGGNQEKQARGKQWSAMRRPNEKWSATHFLFYFDIEDGVEACKKWLS